MELGLTREECAAELGISLRTLDRYETETAPLMAVLALIGWTFINHTPAAAQRIRETLRVPRHICRGKSARDICRRD